MGVAAAAFIPHVVAGGAGGRSVRAVVSVLGAEVLGACCCVVELGMAVWQDRKSVV